MKVAVFAYWFLMGFGGVMGRTPECCCGYGTLCLDFGQGPIDVPCNSLAEQCGIIGDPFYTNGEDCNNLKNFCTEAKSPPCEHGTCVPTFGSYFCDCASGWYGQNCNITHPMLKDVKNPVYIYYQVQSGRKGERVPFHLVYDPGPQPGIMKLAETGVKVHIKVPDGRDYYPMRATEFKQLNVKEICVRDSEAIPDLFDIRVCEFLPEGDHWVYSFDPQFHTKVQPGTEVSFESKIIGQMGKVEINIDYMMGGKSFFSLYHQSFPLFTYSVSKVLNNCKKTITFDGCLADISLPPNIYLRGNTIMIKNIIKSSNCVGTRHISYSWSIQRGPGLNGKYDTVPKKVDFGEARMIIFPERYFTDGIHMIEVSVIVMGDPPHFGGPTEYTIYGRCFIKVELGPLQVQAKGGNLLSSPCFLNQEVTLISLNPSMLISEMTFTSSCRQINASIGHEDPECKVRTTEVPIIRKFHTPCGAVYEFNIVVEHFITKSVKQSLRLLIHYVRNHISLSIACVYNCYPIDSQYRSILVAQTDPYVPASVHWAFTIGDDILDPSKLDVSNPAFLPLSTTRIMRVHGVPLQDYATVLTDVRITASIDDASDLISTVDTVTNNLWREISKFKPTYSYDMKDGVNKIHYDLDPGTTANFFFGPAEFRLVQINSKLRDSIDLGSSNYHQNLSASPDFDTVMLCVHDSMMRACSPTTELNETVRRTVLYQELIDHYIQGDDAELLIKSAIAIYNDITIQPMAGDIWFFRWTDNHLDHKTLVLGLIERVQAKRKLKETDIQALIFILTMVFFSMEGNYEEGLYAFAENFDYPEFYKIEPKDFRDWLNVRLSAMNILHKAAEWVLDYGILTRGKVKLIEYQYGDIVDGIARCWNMAHLQSNFMMRMAVQLTFHGHESDSLEMDFMIIYSENEDKLKRILSIYVKSLYNYARPFYGIRSIGTNHTRFWTTKTSYQGILAAFNKNNTGETLTGFSNYIFGPPSEHEPWLELIQLQLPDLQQVKNFTGKQLFIAVGVVNNRLHDSSTAPSVVLTMVHDERGIYEELPEDQEYELTLPIVIDGVQSNWSSMQLFSTQLLRPSNDSDNYRYYTVYKIRLPIEFEVWNLEMFTQTRTEIKVSIKFQSLPDYDDVDNTKPLSQEYVASIDQFASVKEVKPEGLYTIIPKYFYLGILLSNKTVPDIPIPVMIKDSVSICWQQNLEMNESETMCKGKQLREPLIYCICSRFGFIDSRPQSIRMTRILMSGIELLFDKPFSPLLIGLPVFLVAFTTISVLIACYLDRKRRKHDVLIPMYDTHPLDTYPFIIGVFTSPNLFAGTRSTVAIKLEGRSSSSRVHLLKCDFRRTLKSCSDDWFLMATSQPLGKIQHVLLWHDYHCLSNWYCDHILIYDIRQDMWYMAKVNRWFRLHPLMDDSKMAMIRTFDYGNMESGVSGVNRKIEQYIQETRNTHHFFGIFLLHYRSMYTFENKVLDFLIKMAATFFGSWLVQVQHVFHDSTGGDITEPTLEDIHIDEDTIGIMVIIDAMSYLFGIPYKLTVRSTFMSGLIQKKTTNPMSMDVIRKETITVGAEKKSKTHTTHTIDPTVHTSNKSVLFQLDSVDRTASELSLIKREDVQANVQKQWESKHIGHSRFQKFVTLLFGPCQFRCVNVSPQIFDGKIIRRIFYSRLVAGILLCVLITFIIYQEEFTNFGAKHNVTVFYVLLTTLVDCLIINPIVIFLKSFVMFKFLGVSTRESHYLSEHGRLKMPEPLTYLEYHHTATRKAYKPLLSSEIEKVMKKSTVWHAIRTCIMYSYLTLCIVMFTILQVKRVDRMYYQSVQVVMEAAQQQTMDTGLYADVSKGVNIHDTFSSKKVLEYVPSTFGELQHSWPNGHPMDEPSMKGNNPRWFLDRESKTIGPARIIITFLSSSRSMKIPKYFTKFYTSAYGFVSESTIDKTMVKLGDTELNYTETEKNFKIRGKSGTGYRLQGNEATVPTTNWRTYYIVLTTVITDLIRRGDLEPRVFIISYNIVTVNTMRVSTVDLVVEFMPTGECSVRVNMQSTVIRTDRISFSVLRGFTFLFALSHVAIAISDISIMGSKKFLTHWYGITKFMLSIFGVIVCITTLETYVKKYPTLDKVFNTASDKYNDLHNIIETEFWDTTALGAFLFFMCLEFAVAVKDAMGVRILSTGSMYTFRMLLIMLLIIMIFSRATAICVNVFGVNYDFMVGYFGKSIFPLPINEEDDQKFIIVAVTILCVLSKFCLALCIYRFEVFDENFISEYQPGRSAAVLSKLAPLRDAKEMKMHYLKKHSVRIDLMSDYRQSISASIKRPEEGSKKMSIGKKSLKSIRSKSPSDGERKVEVRKYKLNKSIINWQQ